VWCRARRVGNIEWEPKRRQQVRDYQLEYRLYLDRIAEAERRAELDRQVREARAARRGDSPRVSFRLPGLHRRPRLVPRAAR
jgi:hypothetical protein